MILLVEVERSKLVVTVHEKRRDLPILQRAWRENTRWYHPDVDIVVRMKHGSPLSWSRANAAVLSWLQDNRFPVRALRYYRALRSKPRRPKNDSGYEQLELL